MPEQASHASLDGLHTFPRLLFHHAQVRPEAPAMREKYLGIWQTWTWSAVAERVRALAELHGVELVSCAGNSLINYRIGGWRAGAGR